MALLGYLVLFLNFGPSFHRAPIFDLHGDSAVIAANDVADSPTVGCCCGCDHGSSAATDSTLPTPEQGSISQAPCDCSFCHFFKHFNAAQQETLALLYLQRISTVVDVSEDQVFVDAFLANARGPPIA